MKKTEKVLIKDIFEDKLKKMNVVFERDRYICDDCYNCIERAVIATVEEYLKKQEK